MSRYQVSSQYNHEQTESIGVLLVNLGTPDAPDKASLRRYLAEFLADPRVVEFPRLLWWLVLNLVILNIRPARSAQSYRKIWTDDGSPLLVHSRQLAAKLQQKLQQQSPHVHIALAMRYGNPSIAAGLAELKNKGVTNILVLPLYPQYSATTTASVFDAVSAELQSWRVVTGLRFVNHYHDFEPYINAVANQVKQHWAERGRGDQLLFSFHGIPQRYFSAGDPYFCECQKTARLVASALQLNEQQWSVSFQSRFGKEPWLQPYTDKILQGMPADGITRVDVVCPGFAADCLETLEEIAIENKAYFEDAGGKEFHYIPALNATDDHVDALQDLIKQELQGWQPVAEEDLQLRKQRAQAMGAAQ